MVPYYSVLVYSFPWRASILKESIVYSYLIKFCVKVYLVNIFSFCFSVYSFVAYIQLPVSIGLTVL